MISSNVTRGSRKSPRSHRTPSVSVPAPVARSFGWYVCISRTTCRSVVTCWFNWCRRRELNPRPTHYECVALPLSYCGVPVQIGVEPAGQQARPCPTRRRLSLHHELARPQPPRVGTLLRHIPARATGRKLRGNGVDQAPIVAHWPCNTPNAERPAPGRCMERTVSQLLPPASRIAPLSFS